MYKHMEIKAYKSKIKANTQLSLSSAKATNNLVDMYDTTCLFCSNGCGVCTVNGLWAVDMLY